MTLKEWKARLTPAGVLFLCYFVAPLIVQLFMGASNAIYGGLTFSTVVQAGLGITVVYQLFGLRETANAELAGWLKKFSQPEAKTRELAEKLVRAAGFMIIIAIVWPPAAEMIAGSRLLTLMKMAALGYAGYLGYKLWKLAEPFMAFVPAAAPSEDQPGLPAPASERRCAKCGQLLTEADKPCSFCGQSF